YKKVSRKTLFDGISACFSFFTSLLWHLCRCLDLLVDGAKTDKMFHNKSLLRLSLHQCNSGPDYNLRVSLYQQPDQKAARAPLEGY
ncbi:MAG: hypothetical protein OXT67_07625, partial [Zetaproteobacteria bacterium]|nr:hypothetical protein [Zetaproteobacteria bacterium]